MVQPLRVLSCLTYCTAVMAANGNCDDDTLRDAKFRDAVMCLCHTQCWAQFVQGRRRQCLGLMACKMI